MGFTLSYKSRIITPSLSDLVELGILTKPISEFTNEDIGTEVSIPYTDAGGVISGPIVFEVVGVDHHISDEYSKTITLMTKNIIRTAEFDAAEPKNTDDIDRVQFGNNRWSVSNIRQWLNSSGAADKWFSPRYDYDEAPTYADKPGFLAGFSADVLQHFTEITNITAMPEVDGGGSETSVDKVFLPSYTEMGFGLIGGIAEGAHLSVRYPAEDYDSRIKQWNGISNDYWMRSITASTSFIVKYITTTGDVEMEYVNRGNVGLAPLIVLH